MKKQELIDAVLNHIIKDVKDGDVTAIEELIRVIPKKNLLAYLPEDNSMEKPVMHCPKCGKKITWFNDMPLSGFCWGTNEEEHEEYRQKV